MATTLTASHQPAGRPSSQDLRSAPERPRVTCNRRWRPRSTMPVTNPGRRHGPERTNAVSSTLSPADRPDPLGIVDQRPAMRFHRGHRRRPRHQVLPGHLRHRRPIPAHPPADVPAGPLGKHRTSPDRLALLAPGLVLTIAVGAIPATLTPPQPHRPATRRHVAHLHQLATLRAGPHPAFRAGSP